jgi:lysophospholipid acyltransferase (LPLAT)-like uncharacterized protein
MIIRRWRDKVGTYISATAMYLALRLLMFTCRVRVLDKGNFKELSKKGGFVLLIWHNRIVLTDPFLRRYASPHPYTIVASKNRDGDLIAALTKKSKFGRIIRMPQNGRHAALKAMIRSLNNREVIMIAADGSRGPRYRVKPGVLFAARSASVPVVPFTFAATRYWQLKTWDRMIIPKPFSTVTLGVGEPIAIQGKEGPELAKQAEEISERMVSLDRETFASTTNNPALWPI